MLIHVDGILITFGFDSMLIEIDFPTGQRKNSTHQFKVWQSWAAFWASLPPCCRWTSSRSMVLCKTSEATRDSKATVGSWKWQRPCTSNANIIRIIVLFHGWFPFNLAHEMSSNLYDIIGSNGGLFTWKELESMVVVNNIVLSAVFCMKKCNPPDNWGNIGCNTSI